jgi:hypothetical protein
MILLPKELAYEIKKMNEIERKYDFIATNFFKRKLKIIALNEYEKKILDANLEYFCTSIDKSKYNPTRLHNGVIFYEFEIMIFSRKFKIFFEVNGIDAFALDIKEIE